MDFFKSYLLRQAYKEVERLGDRLAEAEPLIDWEAFRPTLAGIYMNDGPQGGRPNTDPVLMVKMLVLQQCRDFMSWSARPRTGSASAGS